jgi:hypothetical protein
MQIHALGLEDFCEEEYTLIGIHTALEDYRLAYLLNKNLQTCFTKSQKDLEFEGGKNSVSFSIYNFCSTKYAFDWSLIANISKTEHQAALNEFFSITETRMYLIPEEKKVDFFIKISGELDTNFVKDTIKKIKEIEQVITSYSINKDTLKSKDFLIF